MNGVFYLDLWSICGSFFYMLMKNHIFHQHISCISFAHGSTTACSIALQKFSFSFIFIYYIFKIAFIFLIIDQCHIYRQHTVTPFLSPFQNIIRFQIKYIMFSYTVQQGSQKFYFCRMLTCNCITKAAKMKGDNKKCLTKNYHDKKYPQLLFNHKHRRRSRICDLRR
jgi:hypothetical protein